MKLPREFFEEQAQRLSCLDGFPFYPAGVLELADALEESAPDNAKFAREIITAFTRGYSQCPSPRDVSMMAWKLNHPLSEQEPVGKPACSVCGGSGFKVVERKDRITGAESCECRKTPPEVIQ
jgi:hypothetical protein